MFMYMYMYCIHKIRNTRSILLRIESNKYVLKSMNFLISITSRVLKKSLFVFSSQKRFGKIRKYLVNFASNLIKQICFENYEVFEQFHVSPVEKKLSFGFQQQKTFSFHIIYMQVVKFVTFVFSSDANAPALYKESITSSHLLFNERVGLPIRQVSVK